MHVCGGDEFGSLTEATAVRARAHVEVGQIALYMSRAPALASPEGGPRKRHKYATTTSKRKSLPKVISWSWKSVQCEALRYSR